MVEALTRRVALAGDGEAARRLHSEVQLALLREFTTRLRARATHATLLADRRAGDWAEAGGLLHAVAFGAPLLEAWQEVEALRVLADGGRSSPTKAEGAAAAAAAEGVFAGVLREWSALASELEEWAAETVGSGFAGGCERYVRERRAFRTAPSVDESVLPDISAALCVPLAELRAELTGLLNALPPAALRRVWPAVAAAVDTLLADRLIRRTQFSVGGVQQVRRDVDALASLFAPFTARPHAALRRATESVGVLAADAPTRARLLPMLLAAGADDAAADPSSSASAALRKQLEALGAYRLPLDHARELLASVHDDGD